MSNPGETFFKTMQTADRRFVLVAREVMERVAEQAARIEELGLWDGDEPIVNDVWSFWFDYFATIAIADHHVSESETTLFNIVFDDFEATSQLLAEFTASSDRRATFFATVPAFIDAAIRTDQKYDTEVAAGLVKDIGFVGHAIAGVDLKIEPTEHARIALFQSMLVTYLSIAGVHTEPHS